MKKLSIMLLLILFALGATLAACDDSTPASSDASVTPTESTAADGDDGPAYGGILSVGAEPIPPVMGWPPDMIANPSGGAVQGILEFLLRADENGEVIPWLAESYEVAEDKMSITFTLRQGIKFHDGSDFNAEVVKWNLDNWIEAKAQPDWKSVEVIDDYTVKVNLNAWMTAVPLAFCENIAPVFMISKEAFDKNGLEWMRVNPVGTGPFVFESFTPDVELKTVKNPDYWIEGKPYLDGITFKFIGDPMTMALAMQSGEVHTGGAVLALLPQFNAEEYGFEVITTNEANWVLVPDTTNPDSPWANKMVREAVEYAIDKEAIVEATGGGVLEAPYSIASRSALSYDANVPVKREYDPDTAKQMLADAGYPDGFDTTINVFPPAANSQELLLVQSQLKAVGINASLDITDWGRWVTFMGPGSWPENSVLYTPIPRFDKAFLGGMKFTFFQFGQTWERPPELAQAFFGAMEPVEVDLSKITAFINVINEGALLIPVHEGSWNIIKAPGVYRDVDERGYILFWNTEDAWMEK